MDCFEDFLSLRKEGIRLITELTEHLQQDQNTIKVKPMRETPTALADKHERQKRSVETVMDTDPSLSDSVIRQDASVSKGLQELGCHQRGDER
jgi:hypothetical protein